MGRKDVIYMKQQYASPLQSVEVQKRLEAMDDKRFLNVYGQCGSSSEHFSHKDKTCTLVWEARVVGYEMTYGAEFVPSDEAGYTVIVQKARKISATTDEPILGGSFKCNEPGKVVLTFNNQTSKKKIILYRSKTKATTID